MSIKTENGRKLKFCNMKIVFFGTPEYILPVLNSLHKEFKSKNGESPIVAVVTQSPKPTGRTKKLEYSAVDSWAHKKGIPVYFDSSELVKDGIKADLGIVASYGAMIPEEVLTYFPHGLLNIHPSDLPEFRGAAPIQAMLITGKSEAIVSIMKVDKFMDHGPIVSKFKEEIKSDDTTDSLRLRLFEKVSKVLVELIPAYIQGKIKLKEQDHGQAVYTRLIKKEDGFIPLVYLKDAIEGKETYDDWQIPFIYKKDKEGNRMPHTMTSTPHTIERFIRTMNPWPGAWALLRLSASEEQTKRLKILKAHVEDEKLVFDEVQIEGKNPVSWKQFKESYPQSTVIS